MKFKPTGRTLEQPASTADAAFQEAARLHQQGRPFQADALCAEVLAGNPRHPGAWHLRGLIALEGGDIEGGIASIERSLKLQPAQPAAHSNIGTALLGQGQAQRALISFGRALALKPDYPIALFNQGNTLRVLARYPEALESFDAVLARQPEHAPCLNNRGLTLLDLDRLEEAVAALARAAEADPSFTEARRNLAAALLKAGRQEESLRTCDGILAQDPRDAAAWFNRGNVLLAQQQFSDALVSFSRALELGTFADCLINRGDALLKMHRPREALADFDRALQHKPDSVLALNNAGNALLALGHSEEALGRYDAALALDPDAVDSHYNRGAALRDLKRFVEAGQAYATVLKGAPAHEQAAGNLFHVNLDCCDWNRYDELIVRLRADLQSRRWVVNPLSGLLLDEPALQLACARGHVARQYPSQCRVRPPADPGAGESRPLRVAYVSADFREHPVAHLLTGVLERHDRARVSVVGVSLAPAQDSRQGHRMRAACDEMIDAWGMADAEVAALLRSRGIDIAVDAMGFTQGMRLGIFAQRAAPVQVGYVGYAGTTGADFMDYLIADDTVIPHDMKDAYVEQIVRLPHCYLPYEGVRETAAPPTRAAAGLPEQALVLCGFTNAYKINPAIFDAWMRLLRELPEAILWLRPLPDEARANLQREARSRGVDADRLIFAPHVPDMAEHLARQALADLYLDTSPYNAHSTACDALWSGVPLVTCTGRGFASRVAASVLHAAGLSQFVTRDLGQYQDVVLRFARDRELLRQLRHGLLQRRAKLPLFDIATYTRHLEVAYHGMHERVLREGRPSPFNVASLMPRPE